VARLAQLRAVARLPVGIENLAFAFGARDVEDQPAFVEQLLAPSDGFLLLDVHNLYCQAINYGFDPIALMDRYPLGRVRELHVAGGRTSRPKSDPLGRSFRRDGHDDHVPADVFPLVAHALARCPQLEAIVLEHTDDGLRSDEDLAHFRADFMRLRALVHEASRDTGDAVREDASAAPITAIETNDDALAAFQSTFLDTLADAASPEEALVTLRAAPTCAPYRDWIDSFEPRGLEVGMSLVGHWGGRTWEPVQGAMHAVVVERVPGPLRHVARPIPTPGPGQVRLRVHACGLCGTDVHLLEGRFPVPLPIVPGHEPVGEIDALGDGVDGLALGDRVGIPWMQSGCGDCAECARGRAKYCRRQRNWVTNGGGLAELMIVEASGCVRLPGALSFELAAPLFCAGFTVMSGFRRARPREGERIAVLGLGGLGHLAVQIARAHGHEVIAVTRARTKTRDAIALGASDVLVVKEHAGRELGRMGGADVVISTTSDADEAGGAVHGLRAEGRLVALGLGAHAMPIDARALLSRQASVVGAMQDERADLIDLLALAASGAVRPWVEPLPASQVVRAMARLAEGRVRYRAVMRWR
jgi:D-arabinose 1-dehydrogenase-like Zn-dependent alcohol dehydrogenase